MVTYFPTQNHQLLQHPMYAPMTGHLLGAVLHLSLLNSSTKMIRPQQLKSTRFCTLCRTYWKFTVTNLPFLTTRSYKMIDAIPIGGVPWQSSTFTYEGPKRSVDVPKWMEAEYTIWFRDPHPRGSRNQNPGPRVG
jgi:hypothetical protein